MLPVKVLLNLKRDSRCRISSEHLQRDAYAAGVTRESYCQRSARHRLMDRPYSVKPRMPERFSPDSAQGWRCRSSLFQVQLGQYKTGRPLEQLVLAAARGRGCRSSPDHLHNFAARGQCCWSSADQLLPALRKTEAA